jgi:hypothetical protein
MPLTSKKRALIALAALVCAATAAAGVYLYRQKQPLPPANAGRAPDIFSELPSGAPAIAYVDVADLRTLQSTPLASVLGLAAPGPAADRDYQNFVRDTGFDYTRDLDKVAAAFWPANFLQVSSGMGDNRVVAVAAGRFDERKIEAYALRTGKAVTRGTQPVYVVPGNPPVAFEFLSPTRIRIASGSDPLSLLTVSRGPSTDAAMRSRIARVAGAPIFAVARTDQLPDSFYANFRNSPQLEQLARSIHGLTLAGQPDGDDIKTAVDAQCDSMKNAIEITTLLDTFRLVGTMALADPKTRRQMTRQQDEFLTALLSEAKITHQDNWVRLTFDITPAMLSVTAPKR